MCGRLRNKVMIRGRELMNCFFLFPMAFYDLRKKEIPVLPCGLYLLAGQILKLIRSEESIGFALLWIGIFVVLLILPDPAERYIGTGDLMVLTACASVAGVLSILETAFAAVLPATAYALYLAVIRKAGMRETFPFVPFLLIAQVWLLPGE